MGEVNSAFCISFRTRNLCVSKMEPTKVIRMTCPQMGMMETVALRGEVGGTAPREFNSLEKGKDLMD